MAWILLVASCSKPPGQAEFDRGVYELKRENPVRARALLEKSIAMRPGSEDNALAYNYLGVAAWKLGQNQAAQEAFEDSRRLSPTLSEPVYNLAALHLQSGDAVKAAQLFEDAARMNEADPRPVEQLARLYMERQQWSTARRVLHAALNRAPNSARILTALAIVDLNTIGPEKSIESHLIALEKDARYAPALFNVGLIYQTRLREPERARNYFKRFLAQKPGGPAADYARAVLDRPTDATPPNDIAAQPEPLAPSPPPEPGAPQQEPTPPAPMAAKPEPRTPEQREDELIRQSTERVERGDVQGAADALLRAAAEAAQSNRLPAQEKLLRAAARIAFEEPRTHLALGDFLMERQQGDGALRAYKQATALDPQSFAAHYGMARAAMKTGESDTALVGLNAAIRIDPRNADALWDLTQLLDRQLQMPERAISAYREFEKLFPADPRARRVNERIRALTPAARTATPATPPPAPRPVERTPEPETPPVAYRTLERPVTPAPAPSPEPPRASAPQPLNIRAPAVRNTAAATVAFNQGTQLLAQRRPSDAIAAFTRALENDDRFTSAFYNLGLAYSEVGDYEMAKSAYVRALALQPDLHSARYNLALLYFQTRDLNAATTAAQELVRQKPDFAAAQYLLGQIYSERPETVPQARSAYSRFLDLAPNHPAAAVVRQWLATH